MTNITRDTTADEMFHLAINEFENYTERYDVLQVSKKLLSVVRIGQNLTASCYYRSVVNIDQLLIMVSSSASDINIRQLLI